MLENEAYILLNLIPGIGPSRASALIQACGSATAIFDHDWQELSTIRGISQELAHKILETAASPILDEELDRIEEEEKQREKKMDERMNANYFGTGEGEDNAESGDNNAE